MKPTGIEGSDAPERFDDVQWWRVLAYAVVGSLIVFFAARSWTSYGWSLVLVLPLATGLLIGVVEIRESRAIIGGSALVAVALLVFLTVTLGIAGVFCTVILINVCLVPLVVGIVAGRLVRARLLRMGVRSWTALALALMVLPVPGLFLEATDGPTGAVEEVRTVRVIELAPDEAWSHLTFYEDVRLPRPWLARLGLPHPLYTEGDPDRVGAVTRCVYDGGWLRKRITAHEPGRRLAFEVIEQHGIEDRSIELVDSSFELVPTGDGRTRITLTTRYLPLLEARAFWRPWEHRTTRALHDHVIAGITAGAARGGEGISGERRSGPVESRVGTGRSGARSGAP